MSNFLQHLSEIYPLWQQASLYPHVMIALLLLIPVIITVIGIIGLWKSKKEEGKKE